jgi:hypothetical protein
MSSTGEVISVCGEGCGGDVPGSVADALRMGDAIAACAIEKWRQQQPDPDQPDDGFDDRYVQVGTTFGGAAVSAASSTR